VLAAQSESTEADAALEKLCRTYWWPLYGFVRREGYKPEEAQDLTQAFFARLLERRDLETIRQERGRLRSYLLASVKNFLSKAQDRELTVKQGEGRPLVSLDVPGGRRSGFSGAAESRRARQGQRGRQLHRHHGTSGPADLAGVHREHRVCRQPHRRDLEDRRHPVSALIRSQFGSLHKPTM
jgi:Sigma-70 region 2